MNMRIATAEWANPAEVGDRYPYRDGTVWLGRSASEQPVPVGYRDDRHVCVVSGSRGGKGTTSIVNNLILWPGSICVVDPKGENATVTAARRGGGSKNCRGLGQAVRVLDPSRTLVEKLVLLHTVHSDMDPAPAVRAARHFYDVERLLGRPLVLERLADADVSVA